MARRTRSARADTRGWLALVRVHSSHSIEREPTDDASLTIHLGTQSGLSRGSAQSTRVLGAFLRRWGLTLEGGGAGGTQRFAQQQSPEPWALRSARRRSRTWR